MKRYIFLLTLALSVLHEAPARQASTCPECIFIDHFVKSKAAVANQYWPGFNKKMLWGPILYYSGNGTFVVNPNARLKKRMLYTPLSHQQNKLVIGQVNGIVDSNQFNMQVNYEEHDTSVLHYRNAIANVSDLAFARQFVPQIRHLEEWIGMILHETFHQYQTSFAAFKDCQNRTQELLNRDTLIVINKQNPWYKEGIRNEYDVLIKAVNTSNNDSTRIYISQFLELREQRYLKTKTLLHLDIRELEDMLERSEGVARYMEYCLKRTADQIPFNASLLPGDSIYQPGAYRHYVLAEDPFLNKLSTQYVYSTGMTLARLLEKLGIRFQETMYRNNKTFYFYLRSYIGKR